MKSQIKKLDDSLRFKRPKYYNTLQKGLTEKQITELETIYSITIPVDLKQLYLWKNGQSQNCYESFVNNSMFEPLEHVLSASQELTAMIGFDFEIENWWNAHWLPIFSNGGGGYICYDLAGIFTEQQGQLIEFWNKDNDRPVIAPSLTVFLHHLNQYYQQTLKNNFDEYFDINDSIIQFKKNFVVN